jgi:hypothetical protein
VSDEAARSIARLREFGMTEEELDLWRTLGTVAGRFLALPVLHPLERTEATADFHRIQTRLLARPGLRAAGWPSPPDG